MRRSLCVGALSAGLLGLATAPTVANATAARPDRHDRCAVAVSAIDIGTLAGSSGGSSVAVAVNDRGQVVGNSITRNGHTHAFLWDGHRLRDIGTVPGTDTSFATGIDDRGQVIGFAVNPTGYYSRRAFIWDGRMRRLPLPPGSDPSVASVAAVIRENGLIAGTLTHPGTPEHNYSDYLESIILWDHGRPTSFVPTMRGSGPGRDPAHVIGLDRHGGVMALLVDREGDDLIVWRGARQIRPERDVNPAAMNVDGLVAGTDSDRRQAAVWVSTGSTVRDLGTLGGDRSEATNINDRGDVVGRSITTTSKSAPSHAFLYRSGRMADLGTLGGRESEAVMINNRGDVVGNSQTRSGVAHPVLWRCGRIHDLGTRGRPLAWATAINQRGDVVIGGTANADGSSARAAAWMIGPPAAWPKAPDAAGGHR